MPIRIRHRDKPLDRTQPTKDKGIACGSRFNGVLYGQENETPHLMRVNLIIVRHPKEDISYASIQIERDNFRDYN